MIYGRPVRNSSSLEEKNSIHMAWVNRKLASLIHYLYHVEIVFGFNLLKLQLSTPCEAAWITDYTIRSAIAERPRDAVSLKISLSHLRSFKVTDNGTTRKLG